MTRTIGANQKKKKYEVVIKNEAGMELYRDKCCSSKEISERFNIPWHSVNHLIRGNLYKKWNNYTITKIY